MHAILATYIDVEKSLSKVDFGRKPKYKISNFIGFGDRVDIFAEIWESG